MKKIFSLLLFLSMICPTFGQTTSDCHKEGGMFISEMANYGHGEYVEFTVYGSSSNPTAPVNLEGWIVDDNNKPKMDVGNEPGHIRLGDEFSAVMPGTLIALCSNKNKPIEIIGYPYFTKNNNQIITFGKGLIGVDKCPHHGRADYDCKSTEPFKDFKNYVALDNSHDAIQVRNKEGELIHALYWTDEYQEAGNPKAVDIRPIMPNNKDYLGHTTVNFVNDKDWYSVNSFKCEIGGKGTPGEPNYNSYHSYLIKNLKSGFFSSSLKASVSVKQQPSSKNNDGVVEVMIDGGDPEFSITIAIDGEYFRDSKFQNNGIKSITGLKSGIYDIIINDKTGCNPVYFKIEVETAKLICSGSCEEIGVESNLYCKYEWISHPDIINVNMAKQKVCPKSTTIYTLKIIEDGQVKYINFTVEVISAEIKPNVLLICTGSSEEITVKGTNPIWYDGSTENSVKISNPGNYSVTVTNEKGCVATGVVEVLNAEKDSDIAKYFELSGFESYDNVRIESIFGLLSSDLSSRNGCQLIDLSKDILRINNETVDFIEVVDEICETKPNFIDDFYVTDNSRLCKDNNLKKVNLAFGGNSKVYWLHKFKIGNEERIYFKGNKSAITNQEGVLSLSYDIVDGYYPKKEITEKNGTITKISNTNYKINIMAKLNYKIINLSKSNISTTAGNSESIYEAALNKLFPSAGSLDQVINVDFFKGKSPAPVMKQMSIKIDYDVKFNYSFKYVNSFSEIDKRDNILVIIDDAGSTTINGKTINTCGFDGTGSRFMVLDLECFTSSSASDASTVHSICHEEGHHLGLDHTTPLYGSSNVMAYGTSSLNTTLRQKQEVSLYVIQSLLADLKRKSPSNGFFSTKVIPLKGDIKTELYNYLDNSQYSGVKYTPK